MHQPPASIPLMSLDAVVLDTETTGLNPRRDRVVQIAAVALQQGRPREGIFETLVAPGVPIPPAATAIHGISDADVGQAPLFADIADRLAAFVAGRVVIGHNVGFDLAILRAEHQRAGLAWTEQRALDVRFLAQVAEPNLPDYGIDALAHWLGIEIEGRHTAPGDARATAAIFAALIPLLRKRHVRSLAEAETACGRFSELLEAHHRAGWATLERRQEVALSERALTRIDVYPYRHRIRDVMSSPPIVVAPATTMKEAVTLMTKRRISSVFVAEGKQVRAVECGILTERDFMRALAENGQHVLDAPVTRFMRSPLEAVPDEAFLYLAIGRMARLRIRHLGVVDEAGRLVGALSQRDLLRLRASEAIELGDEIVVAEGEAELALAWSRRASVARALVAEGVGGRDVAALLSRSLCSLTRRATQLAESRLAEAGRGGPPAPYAILVMGSGGRGESLLTPDQDNAIVYGDLPAGEVEAADDWFAELGRQVAATLDAAGIPFCLGGVMASNAQWRGGLSAWQDRIRGWVRRQRPQDLLNVDIFFDLRAVGGDAGLARELWHFAYQAGGQATAFVKLLAELGHYDSPVGLFGNIHTENGRLDLKMRGLFPIVAAARVLSIRHQVLERSTERRLQALRGSGVGAEQDLERLCDIHSFFIGLILNQQLRDIEAGIAASNKVQLSRLSRGEMRELKAALGDLGMLDQLVRDVLFAA